MYVNQKRLKAGAIIVIVALVAFASGYALKDKDTQKQSNTLPASQTITPSQTSGPSSTFPGGSTPPSNLDECLRRANNSDAQQEIIEAFRKKCYQQYQ